MGRLAEIQKEYAGTGVQFIGVAMDVIGWGGDNGEVARGYISSTKADYPHVGNTVELTQNLTYIPSTHIYDSSGTMIAKVTGEHSEKDWINIIETLMADR